MTEYYNCPVANWYSATIQEVSVAAVDEKCLTDWIQASQCRKQYPPIELFRVFIIICRLY